MKYKTSIEQRIRGWFPKEPILPTRTASNQTKASRMRVVFQNLALGFLLIAGLLCSILLLNSSWIKFIVITLISVGGLLWRFSHGSLRKAFKFFWVCVLIFAISFTAVEIYMFSNAGYPPTYTPSQPTLSMQALLNASVTEIVQGIEQSPTFRFLNLEHKEIALETIELNPVVTGGICVTYFLEDTHSIVQFTSRCGQQYRVTISRLIGQPFSEKYSGTKPTEEMLQQIDALSLKEFYNKALQIAHNRTCDLQAIDSLSITINFEHYMDYQGITLQMRGHHEIILPDGHIDGEGVLIADFQPDGTLLYMSQPTQQKNT